MYYDTYVSLGAVMNSVNSRNSVSVSISANQEHFAVSMQSVHVSISPFNLDNDQSRLRNRVAADLLASH